MSIKYLSPSGLTEVWSNIKAYIASKIPSKIITGLSIKGRTITYTNSDGTTGTLTTQDTNTTYSVATTSTNGLMSSTDKTKLDGIDAGANNYTHPSSHPASMITGLTKVATSGSYNDLTNKPTIPTVNNATLTIQKNGTTVKTFTANSSTNVTANITVPTKTSELTNNSGFLTSHNPVDSSLSSTSTNAIQNKVVNAALNNKANDSAVVHRSGNETIAGSKTFSNVIYSNKELAYKDTKYDWTDTSLNTWCDAGHTSWSDKTNNRRMHELVGTKDGVWQKVCFINENAYFAVNSNRNITYWGTTIAFNGTTTFTGNVICNGTSYFESLAGKPGNNLWVYAGDLNATYSRVNQRVDGTIAISCVNATTKKSSTMDLKPDGTFTWDGKHIVRTVNGVGANQAGNVNLTNILGFTPVQQGGGTGQLTNKIYIGWTGSQLKCTVDKTDLGAFVFEGRAQVGTTITAYWGSSSSTGNKWAMASALNGTERVSSTTTTFTPVVGQIYSGSQLYSTAMPGAGIGDTGPLGVSPSVVYARLDLSGAFNSSYKYLCTTAVGVNATASVDVTGKTAYGSSGPHTTITGYGGLTKTVQGGKSTFLRVQ